MTSLFGQQVKFVKMGYPPIWYYAILVIWTWSCFVKLKFTIYISYMCILLNIVPQELNWCPYEKIEGFPVMWLVVSLMQNRALAFRVNLKGFSEYWAPNFALNVLVSGCFLCKTFLLTAISCPFHANFTP